MVTEDSYKSLAKSLCHHCKVWYTVENGHWYDNPKWPKDWPAVLFQCNTCKEVLPKVDGKRLTKKKREVKR